MSSDHKITITLVRSRSMETFNFSSTKKGLCAIYQCRCIFADVIVFIFCFTEYTGSKTELTYHQNLQLFTFNFCKYIGFQKYLIQLGGKPLMSHTVAVKIRLKHASHKMYLTYWTQIFWQNQSHYSQLIT